MQAPLHMAQRLLASCSQQSNPAHKCWLDRAAADIKAGCGNVARYDNHVRGTHKAGTTFHGPQK